VLAVAGALACEQPCFPSAKPRCDTGCPGFCAASVVLEHHRLFITVRAGSTAGERAAVVAGTAVLVATSPWGSRAGPAGEDGAAQVDLCFGPGEAWGICCFSI